MVKDSEKWDSKKYKFRLFNNKELRKEVEW